MPKVFISHTASDKPLAQAIDNALSTLYEGGIEVAYSTSDDEGGIGHGKDWYQWILGQVRASDVALVLLTPASIQKPWVLWEAGAVGGVSIATAEGGPDDGGARVRPLVYGLRSADVPSPLRMTQTIRGDEGEGVQKFFVDLMDSIPSDAQGWSVRAGMKLAELIPAHVDRVRAHLRQAPLLVSEAAVQEWLDRLDRFEDRASEVHQLHRWIKIAFGRSDESQDRPLDLRIHRRLAELYAKSGLPKNRSRAIAELELARQLAPRDVFIVRQLGVAYVDQGDFKKADQMVAFIRDLDEAAFEMDADCAGFLGKRYRKDNQPDEAIKVYETALANNSDSYYLANVAAEASLQAGDAEAANRFYRRSLEIVNRVKEDNVWTAASGLNASLALGDAEEAKRWAARVTAAKPSVGQLKSVRAGFVSLAERLADKTELLSEVQKILDGPQEWRVRA